MQILQYCKTALLTCNYLYPYDQDFLIGEKNHERDKHSTETLNQLS